MIRLWFTSVLVLMACCLVASCQEPSAPGPSPAPEPVVESSAQSDIRSAVEAAPPALTLEAGPDPRVRQRQFLAAAQELLQLDGASLSLDQYRAVEARLRGLLGSASAKDSVYLALALLDESHAPAKAFAEAHAGVEPGKLEDVRSRARSLAAISSLEQAVTANPANLAALWHLAFLQEIFDDGRAVAIWQELLQQAPTHLQAMGRLGEGLLVLGKYEQAEVVGTRALALAELRDSGAEAGTARSVLGRVYLQQGQYLRAEEMFKSAAGNADGSHWGCAYQSLGQLYSTLGEVELPATDHDAR